MNQTTRGVAASLVASTLFAVMFYLSGNVGMPAEAVVAWRVVITAGLYGTLLALPQRRTMLAQYWGSLRARWWRGPLLAVLAGLVSFQLWLFTWAPQHGYALDASLGFLLLPIALVLGGRFVLNERMTHGQWSAVVVAIAAVGIQVAFNPALSWVTFAICVGYPVYFLLRRLARLDNPAGFGVEMALTAPAAILLVVNTPGATSATEALTVAVIGTAGAVAMFAYLAASRMLTFPVFGLLNYVEPVLLVVAALLLGEQVTTVDIVVYALLAAALTVLALDGLRQSTSGRWLWNRNARRAHSSDDERSHRRMPATPPNHDRPMTPGAER